MRGNLKMRSQARLQGLFASARRTRGMAIALATAALSIACSRSGGDGVEDGAAAHDLTMLQGAPDLAGADLSWIRPDGGACTLLPLVGNPIMPTKMAGSIPPAMGGPIPDGRYVLSEIRVYDEAPGLVPAQRMVETHSGGLVESIHETDGVPSPDADLAATYQLADSKMTFERILCGGPTRAGFSWSYTAFGGELHYYPAGLGTILVLRKS